MTELNRLVEQEKDRLKSELIKMNYFKTLDGKQLFELTLSELEQIYENVKAQNRRG